MAYYTASKSEPQWLSNVLYDINQRIRDEFVVPDMKRLPFEPFMLYFRGMEITGSDMKHKGGAISYAFEMSRLSEGVKCALQGRKYF